MAAFSPRRRWSGSSPFSPRDAQDTRRVERAKESAGLGLHDFQEASRQLTNKLLTAPRFQDELREITDTLRQSGEARRPLIKISRIRDDTGLVPPINMADYLVEPMEEVFTNNARIDFFSDDPTARDISAGRAELGARDPAFPTWSSAGQ